MTVRQRVERLERISEPLRDRPPPPTWREAAEYYRALLERIGDVDPQVLAAIDAIGEKPDPEESFPSVSHLVLSDAEAASTVTEAIVVTQWQNADRRRSIRGSEV